MCVCVDRIESRDQLILIETDFDSFRLVFLSGAPEVRRGALVNTHIRRARNRRPRPVVLLLVFQQLLIVPISQYRVCQRQTHFHFCIIVPRVQRHRVEGL